MRLTIKNKMTLVLTSIALLFICSAAIVQMINTRVSASAEVVSKEGIPTAMISLSALAKLEELHSDLLENLSGEEEKKSAFQENLTELHTLLSQLENTNEAKELQTLAAAFQEKAQAGVFERFAPAKERRVMELITTRNQTVDTPLEQLLDKLKESDAEKQSAFKAIDQLEHDVVEKMRNILRTISSQSSALSETETSKLLAATKQGQTLILPLIFFTLLLIAVITYLLYRTVFRPMDEINHSMLSLAGGNINCEIHYLDRKDELGDLARAIQQFKEISILRNKAENTLLTQKHSAEIATQYKSDFLANMSHEIRTPMNAIIGLLTLVRKTELNSQQRSYLHKMDLASQNLLGILNDILDFSKIEAGKLCLESIDFDLNDVLQTLSTYLIEKNRDKELDLVYDINPEVPFKLKGDPLRLGQILLNLGSNAIKFTNEGEVVLSISVNHLSDTDVSLDFKLRDTGIGMSSATQEQIMQPFMQADLSTTRKYGGTGLGLSITRQLISLMGGKLQVRSTLQEGSCFHFTLLFPYSKEKNVTFNEKHKEASGTRVILGDSNNISRISATEVLHSLGINVIAAEEGKEVIALFEKFKNSPEELITILDYNLKNEDCLKTAEILQTKTADKRKLIFSTSVSSNKLLNQMEEMKPTGILMKPYSKSTLFDTLADALGKNHILRAVRDNKSSSPRFHGTKILVAEDNETNREVIDELLTDLGCEIVLAQNGAEAVDILQKLQGKIDLVFMDVQMPTMDGLTATAKIRNELHLHALPIIALTAHAIETQKQACIEAGMNDHVSKPINQRELIAAIERWKEAPEKQIIPTEPPVHEEEVKSKTEPAPLLDPVEGIDRFGGKESIYRKTLGSFCDTFNESREKIRTSIEASPAEVAKVVHNLKGVAGTLAASRLHKLCIETEHFCNEVHIKELRQHLQQILTLMDRTKEEMLNYLQEHDEPIATPQSDEIPLKELHAFERALKHSDASAVLLFEKVKPHLQNQLSAEQFALLLISMGQLDFPKALTILAESESGEKDS